MTDPKDAPAPTGGPTPEADGPPATDATDAPEVPEAPEAVAADDQATLAACEDRFLRLAAEYDNFRKRTARERDELRTRAQADLARRLLDALDDLGRVADLDPAATAAQDVIAGVELVERKVLRELSAAGMEPVAQTDVPFDPALHEAIATVPAESPEQDHTVAAVLQPGYRFNGFLLRPARVQVRIHAPTAE